MNDLSQKLIDKTLKKLGIDNYALYGEPTNEEEFYSFLKIPIGVDHTQTVIYEENRQNYPITFSQFNTEYSNVKTEWQLSKYQRDRAPEYPSAQELADALYWQSKGDNNKMAAYITACETVKAKYPKP
jgi:hypothetical protein